MCGQMLHQSVLLNEVVDALRPAVGKAYLDATFGNGGYSRALLDTDDCTVIAIDRDPDAIARGQMMVTEYKPRFALRRLFFRYAVACTWRAGIYRFDTDKP